MFDTDGDDRPHREGPGDRPDGCDGGGDPAGLGEVIAVLASASTAAVRLDWSTMDDDDARGAVLAIEGARRQVTAVLAAGLDHLDRRTDSTATTGLPAHRWLAHRTHGSTGTTKRCARAGRVLTLFSGFARAIGRGELSDDHATAIHNVANPRVLDALIEAEPTLLELARRCTYPQFCRGLRRIVSLLDDDGPQPDCRDSDAVNHNTTEDGTFELRATFSGHQAVTISHALSVETIASSAPPRRNTTAAERRSRPPQPCGRGHSPSSCAVGSPTSPMPALRPVPTPSSR